MFLPKIETSCPILKSLGFKNLPLPSALRTYIKIKIQSEHLSYSLTFKERSLDDTSVGRLGLSNVECTVHKIVVYNKFTNTVCFDGAFYNTLSEITIESQNLIIQTRWLARLLINYRTCLSILTQEGLKCSVISGKRLVGL